MIRISQTIWTMPSCSRVAGFVRNYSNPAVDLAGSNKDPEEFHKTFTDGTAHVTQVNVLTEDRSIVELKLRENITRKKMRREFSLPDDAVAGLRNLIVNSEKLPKQLQHEADQLNETLKQRRFPASPYTVKQARREIRARLKVDDLLVEDDLGDPKIREAREYDLRNKVDKHLRKTHFNWKPLEFENQNAALTYGLARLARNYAEIARVLEEFPRDYRPQSILDYGGGCGAAYWACRDKFDGTFPPYTHVDISDHMTRTAMDIMRGEADGAVPRGISFRRHLLPSMQTTYDLVILHGTLGELGSAEERQSLIEALWNRTNRYLVIVESGRREWYEAVMEVRDMLLQRGRQIDMRKTYEILEQKGLVDDDLIAYLRSRDVSAYEKFQVLKEKLEGKTAVPTVLDAATVFAPCPHDMGCPLQRTDVCEFPIRWRNVRADGKRPKEEKDGSATGSVSFVIMEKGERQGISNEPILKMRRSSGHLTCDVCTRFRGVQRMSLSKRAGILYKETRGRREGDTLPLETVSRVSEGAFDLFDAAKETIQQEKSESGQR